MIKRLFEYIALSILAILGLAKLKGKRVNPVALRVLLALFSFMALCLDTRLVLLYSGTWLLFLLAGDLGRLYGYDLTLFVPSPSDAEAPSPVFEPVEQSLAKPLETPVAENNNWLHQCQKRIHSFFPSFKGKEK